jgi:hypothetical protein
LAKDGRGVHGGQRRIGAVDRYLAVAIQRALTSDQVAAVAEARNYGWEACTDRFLDGLATDAPIGTDRRAKAA